MESPSHIWRTENDARRKSAFAIALVIFSLVQIVVAIIWLPIATGFGIMFMLFHAIILMIGVSFLLRAKEVIIIDAQRQTIVLETIGPLGTKVTEVSLGDVADVSVRYDGDSDDGTIRYYVAARLKTGSELALFRGFHKGNRDRGEMESRCERLRRLLPAEA